MSAFLPGRLYFSFRRNAVPTCVRACRSVRSGAWHAPPPATRCSPRSQKGPCRSLFFSRPFLDGAQVGAAFARAVAEGGPVADAALSGDFGVPEAFRQALDDPAVFGQVCVREGPSFPSPLAGTGRRLLNPSTHAKWRTLPLTARSSIVAHPFPRRASVLSSFPPTLPLPQVSDHQWYSVYPPLFSLP